MAYFGFLKIYFKLKNYSVSKIFIAIGFHSRIPYIDSSITGSRRELQTIPLEEAFYYLCCQNSHKTRILKFGAKFFLGHFSYDLTLLITFFDLNSQVPPTFLLVALQAMLILKKSNFPGNSSLCVGFFKNCLTMSKIPVMFNICFL